MTTADLIERLATALRPLAAVPLWRDTYPDAKHQFVVDERMRLTVADVQEARKCIAVLQACAACHTESAVK